MKNLVRYFKTKVFKHPIRFIISIPFKIFEYTSLILWGVFLLLKEWDSAIIIFIIAIIGSTIGELLFPSEWWIECKQK